MPVPKNVHFIYIANEEGQPFSFAYFLAVLSAYYVLKPNYIYLHYHGEPKGVWWNTVGKYATLKFLDEIPSHIGSKRILKTAHVVDAIRMQILLREGGVYLDLDTLSHAPLDDLLSNDMVMGLESPQGLCNAILIASKDSKFLRVWWDNYEDAFDPNGWGEASILLPKKLADGECAKDILMLPQEVFFWPDCHHVDMIFTGDTSPHPSLRILHWWNTNSRSYIANIDIGWLASSTCMFATIARPLLPYIESAARIHESQRSNAQGVVLCETGLPLWKTLPKILYYARRLPGPSTYMPH